MKAIAGLALLAMATGAAAGHQTPQRVDTALEGWPLEPFVLVDQHGESFTQERLLGQWTFVLLADTQCAAPCAAALAALAGLAKRIAPAKASANTQVLFISLDPARDTPARLKTFLAPYDERWIGATGSAQTLARLVADLGEHSHGDSVILVGPEGSVQAEYLAPYDMPWLTADFLKRKIPCGCGRKAQQTR